MKLRMKSILLTNLNLLFGHTFSERIVFTYFTLSKGTRAHWKTLKQYKLITKKL